MTPITPSDEWLTQEAIAQMIDAPIQRVRAAVQTLVALDQIRTAPNAKDRRYILVQRDGVPLIRRAVFGV